MLTKRQRDLLVFISTYIAENGFSPSYGEMAAGIGEKSKSSIHRLVWGLENRGFIHCSPDRPRGIEVLQCPVSPGQWRRVQGVQQLPPRTKVLAYSPSRGMTVWPSLLRWEDITHWMPLPESPRNEDQTVG